MSRKIWTAASGPDGRVKWNEKSVRLGAHSRRARLPSGNFYLARECASTSFSFSPQCDPRGAFLYNRERSFLLCKKTLCEWTNHLHRVFLLFMEKFSASAGRAAVTKETILRAWGVSLSKHFWSVQSGQNRKTCICLHCLPICNLTAFEFF